MDRSMTRVFFTTDIHGSDPAFNKFINAASFYKADAIVLGGDITGKMVISVVKQPEGWEANLFGQKHVATVESELEELERIIRTNGFYPYRTTADEVEVLASNPELVDELFTRLMKESVETWMETAERKLSGTDVRCFVSLGNDDRDDIIPIIEESDVVIYADGKVVDLDEKHEMASVGYSNMTPWHCPRDLTEDELARKINDVVSSVTNMGSCVFNFHVPPYNSELDYAPELDEEMKPVLVGGMPNITPVGSTAVREAIEEHQPLAGLHGHIHESRAVAKIGRTLCINPGSEYSEGMLRGVLLNIRDGKVLSHQFVSG
jgi:Icc-related predicted phosphoesterase